MAIIRFITQRLLVLMLHNRGHWRLYMKLRTTFFITGILIGLNSCAKKNYTYYGVAHLNSKTNSNELIELKSDNFEVININIDSEVFKFEKIENAATMFRALREKSMGNQMMKSII